MYNDTLTMAQPMAETEGISTKLKRCLLILNESSTKLKDAIIKRKPHIIWEVLADQEKTIREFEQYSYLWTQLFNADETKNSPSVVAFRDILRNDIKQLKRITDSNSKLATSFLSAVRKALQHTGTNLANKSKLNV